MRGILRLIGLTAVCAVSSAAQTALPDRCKQLESLDLPNGRIGAAVIVPAAAFPLRSGVTDASASIDLPAYCRVTLTTRPNADSDIGVEVWMPLAEWNEKFLGTGNVNWCGGVNQLQMALGLRGHYATAGTDRGHNSCDVDSSFSARSDKLANFGFRAVHEMTVMAKALVMAYYVRPPKRSYFTGGSSGGGEALMEVQRYPEDYDGAVAGAPTNNWTRLMAASVFNSQTASVFSRDKLRVLHEAVLAACDSPDQIGLLDDPRQCRFEPEALLCPSNSDSPKCLTQTQVDAARKVYTGPTDPRTGVALYPGLERGSKLDGVHCRAPARDRVPRLF